VGNTALCTWPSGFVLGSALVPWYVEEPAAAARTMLASAGILCTHMQHRAWLEVWTQTPPPCRRTAGASHARITWKRVLPCAPVAHGCRPASAFCPVRLQQVAADLNDSDVEDARTGLLPRNPSELLVSAALNDS